MLRQRSSAKDLEDVVDLRRIPVAACLLIVALRMSIGWQFLYEGLWKIHSQSTANPWSAEGYLKNAEGPFRKTFRDMTGDPDDKRWLNYDSMLARWTDWHGRFLARHPDLSDAQRRQLDLILDGPAQFSAPLETLPETVEFKGSLAQTVSYDADRKRLIVSGERHLNAAERAQLDQMVADNESPEAVAFRNAVDEVYRRSSRLSYKERLAASLKGDPARAGVTLPDQKGTIDYNRMGEIKLYEQMLEDFKNRPKPRTDFERKHQDRAWAEIQELKNKVVGPVKALERDLHADALRLLTAEQMARGPVAAAVTEVDRINTITIWSLVVLGALLMGGLFSRLAALLGAGMLVMFYLPMPPWPGVPDLPGPEHSFIVNKNFIEALALLAIAAMPTGQWFGVDRWFQRLIYGRRERDIVPPPGNTTTPAASSVPTAQRVPTTAKK